MALVHLKYINDYKNTDYRNIHFLKAPKSLGKYIFLFKVKSKHFILVSINPNDGYYSLREKYLLLFRLDLSFHNKRGKTTSTCCNYRITGSLHVI